MTRFLLADDHLIVLLGTQQLIREQFPDSEIKIVETFDEAIIQIQNQPFDIAILDINLPGGNRIAMVESLRLRQKSIKILIFSALEEKLYATPYMKAGADGYVSKRATPQELYTAITLLMEGKKYVSPAMQQICLTRMFRSANSSPEIRDGLSQKETEVMNLLLSGMTTNEIAAKLAISAPAISSYKSKIFRKFSVKNILDLKDIIENAN